MNDWPVLVLKPCASARASTSTGPPAENPTKMRTGLNGYCCAFRGDTEPNAKSAAQQKIRAARFMSFPFSSWQQPSVIRNADYVDLRMAGRARLCNNYGTEERAR